MKAPFILSSAIQKVVAMAAFLPLVTVVYPHAALAATAAQNSRENALVFDTNSKPTTTEYIAAIANSPSNPTLTNPCYPGPVGSCNPDASPMQQPTIKAQAASVELANLNSAASQPGATTQTGTNYSPDEVQQLIIQYSAQYGIDPATPLCIARFESGYNQFSKNRRSTASGVFQFLTSTWRGTDEGRAGLSVFDADANVRAGVKYMAANKSTQAWSVRSKCPKVALAQ